jgi:hypothetical protein
MADARQLAVYTRMFSPAVVRAMGATGRSALLARLVKESGASHNVENRTVEGALEYAFGVLKATGNRDDYVYRSAVIQKLFIARHSFRTATALLEARSGSSRADVVILNGTSTAYEIKSERDSFARLHNQVLDYRQTWASVNVVTSAHRASEVRKLVPGDVGIIILSDRFTLHVEREAIDLPERISPLFLLNTLRNDEALAVLAKTGLKAPSLPNTLLRSYLESEFSKLESTRAHTLAVEVIKATRSQASIETSVRKLPTYLRAAGIGQRFSDGSYARLQAALATPLPQALNWS